MFRGLVAAACAASLMAPPEGAAPTSTGGDAGAPNESNVAEALRAPPALAGLAGTPKPAPDDDSSDVMAATTDDPWQPTAGDDEGTGGAVLGTPSVPPPTLEAAGGPVDSPSPRPRNTLGCKGNAGCVKLTAGGIVVSTLSAGTLAGGVVLTLRDDEVLADDPTRMRTYRPAGEMMLTLGAGLLATGVLMLVASRYGDGLRDPAAKRRRGRRAGAAP